MTKGEYGSLLKERLGIGEWLMNSKLPGAIWGSREIADGIDRLYFTPRTNHGGFAFGPSLYAGRQYLPVVAVLQRVSDGDLGMKADSLRLLAHRPASPIADIYVRSREEFEEIVSEARAMVCEDILPELERYRYLGPLHALIEATDPTLRSGKFGSKPHQAHIAIIKRLVGAADWESYMTHWEKVYREYVQTPEGAKFTKEAEILTRLSELLPDVTPLSTQEAWGPEGNMEAS